MVVREVVLDQQVCTEVVGGVAPHAVHVVRVVLGVVELDEGDGALDAEVVRLLEGSATGPGEMQLLDATGGGDAVRSRRRPRRFG